MADISTNPPLDGRLQALCLARPIEVWTSNDAASGRSYTEQSPIAGLPAADRASYATIVPGGTPTGTTGLDIRCQHGGLPGQIDHGMATAVRRSGETLWAGWEQQGAISRWECPEWAEATVLSDPSIVAMPDGTLVIAVRSGVQIRVYTKAAAATSWTDRGVISDTLWTFYPCLVVIEEEVYCLAWRSAWSWDTGTSDPARAFYIGVWRSTDSGATWGLVQDFATTEDDVRNNVLSAAGGAGVFSCGRIRADYRDGEVCVLATLREQINTGNDQDWIRHWAGPGLTTRLDLVETFQVSDGAGNEGVAKADVVATPAGFFVAMLGRARNPLVATIGSAWQPITTAGIAAISIPYDIQAGSGWTLVAGTSYALADDDIGECSLAYDPSGVIWLFTAATNTAVMAGTQYVYYSPDGGDTWIPGHGSRPAVNNISGYWYRSVDVGVAPPNPLTGTQEHYLTELDAVWYRGMAVVVHSWIADVYARSDEQIGVAYLGGWTDLCLPYEDDGVRIGDRVGWLHNVLPLELPENQDYGVVQAGTQTSALVDPGVHQMTTGDGALNNGQNYYSFTGVDNGTEMHGGFEWQVLVNTTEGNGTQCQIGGRMRLASATHGCEVEVNLTTTGIYVRDLVAGTALGSATALTPGTYVVRLGMSMTSDTGNGRGVQAWYRLITPGVPELRRWTRIGAWTLQDDLGVGGATPWIKWGHIVSSGGTTVNDSEWVGPYFFLPYNSSVSTVGTGATWHDLDQAGGDNPAILAGRPLGSEQVYAMGGFTMAGRRGPGLIGDSWTVPVSGEYEIARAIALDTPSRRIHHRTVDNSANVVIPWALDPDRPLAEDAVLSPWMALHVQCNWRLATLQYRTVAGGWTTAATIDTRVLQGVSFARTGKFLQANSAASTVYLHRDEVDSYWTTQFDDGAGTTRYRHPAGNAGGRWTNAITEPRAKLELASTLAGDPTGGGTLSLWSPHVTVLFAPVTSSAWRLNIDSTYPTADGDYRTHFYWCDVHILAQPPSWGRGFTALPGYERVALEGDLGVRVDRAPSARELRLAYDDGIDETEIGSASIVSYVTATTGGVEPASCVGELPRSLVRMLERQAGRPVGWVVWNRTAPGAVVLRRQHEQFWGTVPASPDIEVVLGEEGSTEVQRLGTTIIREER